MKALAASAGSIREVMDATSSQVGDVAGEIAQIATAAEEQTTATSEISTNMQGSPTRPRIWPREWARSRISSGRPAA